MLSLINWDSVTKLYHANAAYNRFLEFFSEHYDIAFPKQNIKIKSKILNSAWIAKGLQRSSKRKQKLCGKFLKKEIKSVKTCKTFETLK